MLSTRQFASMWILQSRSANATSHRIYRNHDFLDSYWWKSKLWFSCDASYLPLPQCTDIRRAIADQQLATVCPSTAPTWQLWTPYRRTIWQGVAPPETHQNTTYNYLDIHTTTWENWRSPYVHHAHRRQFISKLGGVQVLNPFPFPSHWC